MFFCQGCKTKTDEALPFCRICGRSTSSSDPVTYNPSFNAAAAERKMPRYIRCKQCGYDGRGQFGRSQFWQAVAWLAILVFVPFTIIYFLTSKKYKCPKCQSVELSVLDKNGEFKDQ